MLEQRMSPVMAGESSDESVSTSSEKGSGWERLLALLDPDPVRAARRYREARGRLIDLFRWRRLGAAEDLADDTLHRVSARLAEGEIIRGELGAYIAGVARRVALEAGRRQKRTVPLTEERAPATVEIEPPTDDHEARDRCATRCLDELPGGARDLIVRYHVGRGRTRIAERRRIADELGIPMNALRIRVHRMRGQLETCIQSCLGGSEAP
jgi:DNA-directed RNA polymerase specialized sigma24 family protein